MKHIYAVYDIKGNLYFQPHFFRNSTEALRAFEATCQDESTNFNKYPSDFTMVQIGTWDEDSGKIKALDDHLTLATAADFVGRNSGGAPQELSL